MATVIEEPSPRLNILDPTEAGLPLQSEKTKSSIRTDWKKDEIAEIYNLPLMQLASKAVSHPNADDDEDSGKVVLR